MSKKRSLLNAKEAAKYLQISRFTLRKLEKSGKLRSFRTPGGHRRYSIETLNRYLQSTR